MEETEVRQIVVYLFSAYPTILWDEDKVDVWCQELLDLDFDATREIAREWVRHEERPPTIAGIRRRVAELNRPPLELVSERQAFIESLAEKPEWLEALENEG